MCVGASYCLEHIFEWVWLFRADLQVNKAGCYCLEQIFGQAWVIVTVERTFMRGCAFSEKIYRSVWRFRTYGWVWLFRAFLRVGITCCNWLWVIVTGFGACGWVWPGMGKSVKTAISMMNKITIIEHLLLWNKFYSVC